MRVRAEFVERFDQIRLTYGEKIIMPTEILLDAASWDEIVMLKEHVEAIEKADSAQGSG